MQQFFNNTKYLTKVKTTQMKTLKGVDTLNAQTKEFLP